MQAVPVPVPLQRSAPTSSTATDAPAISAPNGSEQLASGPGSGQWQQRSTMARAGWRTGRSASATASASDVDQLPRASQQHQLANNWSNESNQWISLCLPCLAVPCHAHETSTSAPTSASRTQSLGRQYLSPSRWGPGKVINQYLFDRSGCRPPLVSCRYNI